MCTPNEPPPLPTAETQRAPQGDEAGNNPFQPYAPAPLHWRALAFLCDWFVAALLLLLVVRLLVHSRYSLEFLEAKAWLSALWHNYQQLLMAGPDVQAAQANDIIRQSMEIPASAGRLVQAITSAQISVFGVYFFAVEFFTKGASLGKKIFNLRTARMVDLESPGILDTFIRAAWKSFFFGSPHLFFLLIGLVDALVPLSNPWRRSLHDLLARTIVLDAAQMRPGPQPIRP